MLGAKGFTLDKNLFRQREIIFNTFIMLLELVSSVSNKFNNKLINIIYIYFINKVSFVHSLTSLFTLPCSSFNISY